MSAWRNNREETLKFMFLENKEKQHKIRNATLSCVNAKVGWWNRSKT